MNQTNRDKRIQIVKALVEGNSINSTSRMTGSAKNTILKLLTELGAACTEFQDLIMRDLPCQRLQCDEIWSFCYAKEKNVPKHKAGEFGYGDVWTWTAICADTKLIPHWFVSTRDAVSAMIFMKQLAARLASPVQITTDGHKPYVQAVAAAFGTNIDFAMLQKQYGGTMDDERRYSPAVCTGTLTKVISGSPDPAHVNTSFIERSNLTLRMSQRRFTRLTNAHSKKIQNHEAAIALHMAHYNFCRVHSSLKMTPAQAAGIADHAWSVGELIDLLDKRPKTKES